MKHLHVLHKFKYEVFYLVLNFSGLLNGRQHHMSSLDKLNQLINGSPSLKEQCVN